MGSRLLTLLLVSLASCGDLSPATTVERGRAKMDDARALRVQQEIRWLESELEQRHVLRGEWPRDWSFIHRSASDPWGHEYVFFEEDGRAVVYTLGPDGVDGTGDEIYSD